MKKYMNVEWDMGSASEAKMMADWLIIRKYDASYLGKSVMVKLRRERREGALVLITEVNLLMRTLEGW